MESLEKQEKSTSCSRSKMGTRDFRFELCSHPNTSSSGDVSSIVLCGIYIGNRFSVGCVILIEETTTDDITSEGRDLI